MGSSGKKPKVWHGAVAASPPLGPVSTSIFMGEGLSILCVCAQDFKCQQLEQDHRSESLCVWDVSNYSSWS